ncbi:Calcineurin subunit B [Tritrichomonas musculus]|uniref:Calcineurin subunit B n=1 Tax=Tritrichomonas musculus TaxID=1915356 RepID=A0ABR2HN16_9EUKA
MPPKKVKIKRANSKNISKEELKLLKKEFRSIDTDHSGELDRKELETFMLKNNFETEFAHLAIKLFDENGDGLISFKEFVNFTQALAKLDKDPNLLQRMLFTTLDKDDSGYLEENEIRSFFRDFADEKLSDEEIHNVIENLDTNCDGKLSFDELMCAFKS